jgi:hypothetical protein
VGAQGHVEAGEGGVMGGSHDGASPHEAQDHAWSMICGPRRDMGPKRKPRSKARGFFAHLDPDKRPDQRKDD